MTNKEFIEKSKKEVIQLNGSKDNDSYQAWRDGYMNAVREVADIIKNSEDNSDFIDKIQFFSEQELEVFEFNL